MTAMSVFVYLEDTWAAMVKPQRGSRMIVTMCSKQLFFILSMLRTGMTACTHREGTVTGVVQSQPGRLMTVTLQSTVLQTATDVFALPAGDDGSNGQVSERQPHERGQAEQRAYANAQELQPP